MSDNNHPRCMHLCCKSMLVFGEDFQNDPEFQAGIVEYWCTQTATGWGPDSAETSLELCSNPERSCYKEF